jgi:hypothetical protein
MKRTATIFISDNSLTPDAEALINAVRSAKKSRRPLCIFCQFWVGGEDQPHALAMVLPTHDQGKRIGEYVARIGVAGSKKFADDHKPADTIKRQRALEKKP